MDIAQAVKVIMEKHDDAINDEEGERPFNEPGEVIEAIWAVYDGKTEWLIKSGWLAPGTSIECEFGCMPMDHGDELWDGGPKEPGKPSRKPT